MNWQNCLLGDFLTLKRGHDLPSHVRQQGSIPVVSSAGITGYHSEAKACAPGVVTGRYGTLGEVFFLEEDYWPLNTALYVVDFKGNDPRFTSYFLKNILKDYQSDKAAIPGVDRNVLHALQIKAPDADTQIRISHALSSYDDLIENNSRRIKLLEETARLLYREWFVYLRFPGHEHAETTSGVPKEWQLVPLSSVCSDIRDAVKPDQVEPDTPYIGLEHIPRRSITLNEWGFAEDVESNKLRYIEGDILFGKIRPYFHKVGFTLTDGICSSDAIVIRAHDKDVTPYVLALVSSDQFVAIASKTAKEGSKMPRADWKFMQQHPVLLPSRSVLLSFRDTMLPIMQQLKALALQNQKLAQARDLLLPRLMNGEITV